jgi:hypothetical protein
MDTHTVTSLSSDEIFYFFVLVMLVGFYLEIASVLPTANISSHFIASGRTAVFLQIRSFINP